MSDVDIRTLEDANSSWEQTGKDLGSGAAGGIAQVLLGESHDIEEKMVHCTLLGGS